MYSILLVMALNTSADVPAYYRCGHWGCGYATYGHCGHVYGCYTACYSYPYHGCYHGYPCHIVPSTSGTEPKKDGEGKPTPKPKPKDGETSEEAPATIVVSLPEDARLLVDDSPTTSTSGTRVLVTPNLTPGSRYHYTLKAEVVRDGKVETVSEKVTVEAGKTSNVTLSVPEVRVVQR